MAKYLWSRGPVFVALAVGSLILASCATAPSSPAPSGSPADDTKPYGRLTVALDFTNSPIDTKFASAGNHTRVGWPIFDLLAMPDAKARAIPGLAERWEISPDGKTHTFYIRKGVKFHDGSDLTGADVKFSLERILAPDARNMDSRVWKGQVAGVDLKDDYTLALRLNQPQFELLKGFEDFAGTTAVVPKKYVESVGDDAFSRLPMASGPFKALKWEPMDRLELEAVDNHWRVAPKFKNVTMLNILEESTKVAMLKTGELDMAEISSDSVPALKAAGLKIGSWEGARQMYGVLLYDLNNPEQYAIGDVRVRKALSLATNRKEMAEKIYGGYAQPSSFFYVTKSAYFWDSNLVKEDPYDPEGAKKLMAEAGYANGFPIKVWEMGEGGILSNLSTAMAGYWRKIGIDATLVPRKFDTSLFNPVQKPEAWPSIFPGITTGGVFQFEKMVTMWHPTKGSPKNHTNTKLGDLIDKVPLTVDPAEKKRMSLEAVVLARDTYAILGILDIQSLVASGPKVGGFTPIAGLGGIAPFLENITHAQ